MFSFDQGCQSPATIAHIFDDISEDKITLQIQRSDLLLEPFDGPDIAPQVARQNIVVRRLLHISSQPIDTKAQCISRATFIMNVKQNSLGFIEHFPPEMLNRHHLLHDFPRMDSI